MWPLLLSFFLGIFSLWVRRQRASSRVGGSRPRKTGQGRGSTFGSLGHCGMQRNESEPQTLIRMSKDADWRKTGENSSQVN